MSTGSFSVAEPQRQRPLIEIFGLTRSVDHYHPIYTCYHIPCWAVGANLCLFVALFVRWAAGCGYLITGRSSSDGGRLIIFFIQGTRGQPVEMKEAAKMEASIRGAGNST